MEIEYLQVIAGVGGRSDEPSPERVARYRWAAEAIGAGRVLDAGCGAGWGAGELARSCAEVVGVDLSPGAIGEARAACGQLAEFVEGNLAALPFADEEFEHVVCFEALAQVDDPPSVLDELRRVLRPGGLLLVSAPNPAVYPPGNPLHLSETTPAELERLLAARFANVAVHRQQTYFASLLGDAALLARADPSAEVRVAVTKCTGGDPGSELHAVAAATDGPLPAAPSRLAIGEDFAQRRARVELEEWQERAIRAEAQALALKHELNASQS